MPKKQTSDQLSSGNFFQIAALAAENFMNLKAVNIKIDGDGAFVIGGDPESGKSNAVEIVWSCLGGREFKRSMLLRKGQTSGFAETTLKDPATGETVCVARRQLTLLGDGKVKDELVIHDAAGKKLGSPQTLLDAIWNLIALMPDRFITAGGAYRRKQLLQLIGAQDKLDEIARERGAAFDKRTDVNRDLAKKKAILSQLTEPDADQPREKTPLDDILKLKDDAQAVIDANRQKRDELEAAQKRLMMECAEIKRLQNIIHDSEEMIRRAQTQISSIEKNEIKPTTANIERLEKVVADIEDPDKAEIDLQIKALEETNDAVAEAIAYDQAKANVGDLMTEAEGYTALISELDAKRDGLLKSAKFPIKGLSVNDDDVTLADIPFDQLANSRQHIVAAEIGMALKPQLKAVLFTEAAGIQGSAFVELEKSAKAKGFQLIMASSAHEKQATIIIHDGEVYSQ